MVLPSGVWKGQNREFTDGATGRYHSYTLHAFAHLLTSESSPPPPQAPVFQPYIVPRGVTDARKGVSASL